MWRQLSRTVYRYMCLKTGNRIGVLSQTGHKVCELEILWHAKLRICLPIAIAIVLLCDIIRMNYQIRRCQDKEADVTGTFIRVSSGGSV